MSLDHTAHPSDSLSLCLADPLSWQVLGSCDYGLGGGQAWNAGTREPGQQGGPRGRRHHVGLKRAVTPLLPGMQTQLCLCPAENALSGVLSPGRKGLRRVDPWTPLI